MGGHKWGTKAMAAPSSSVKNLSAPFEITFFKHVREEHIATYSTVKEWVLTDDEITTSSNACP